MTLERAVAAVFIIVYAYVIFAKKWQAAALWIGVVVLFGVAQVLGDPAGHLGLRALFIGRPADPATGAEATRAAVNWNILGIFAGTLVLSELFLDSRVPALLANRVVSASRTAGMALLWICVLGSLISMFVANVAAVLIVAPVGLEVSRRLRIAPAPFLIGLAVSANLQGMAMLIGDPPSMLLAAHEGMTFNDFFFMRARGTVGPWKPGIFFATQVGAIASLGCLYLIFRRYRQPVQAPPPVRVGSWVPTILLALSLATLACASLVDPDFRWFAGVSCVAWAIVGVVWATVFHGWGPTAKMLARYDIETTAFLAGVFILAYAMDKYGHVATIARAIEGVVGGSPALAYVTIVLFSVLASAFLDNVPYTALMLPVAGRLAVAVGLPTDYVLTFGLLIGACLGGNITPVGASANVVALGLLRREGESVGFWRFAKIGVPFTLSATLAGALFVWLVWGP